MVAARRARCPCRCHQASSAVGSAVRAVSGCQVLRLGASFRYRLPQRHRAWWRRATPRACPVRQRPWATSSLRASGVAGFGVACPAAWARGSNLRRCRSCDAIVTCSSMISARAQRGASRFSRKTGNACIVQPARAHRRGQDPRLPTRPRCSSRHADWSKNQRPDATLQASCRVARRPRRPCSLKTAISCSRRSSSVTCRVATLQPKMHHHPGDSSRGPSMPSGDSVASERAGGSTGPPPDLLPRTLDLQLRARAVLAAAASIGCPYSALAASEQRRGAGESSIVRRAGELRRRRSAPTITRPQSPRTPGARVAERAVAVGHLVVAALGSSTSELAMPAPFLGSPSVVTEAGLS